jgi:hypothetical protein
VIERKGSASEVRTGFNLRLLAETKILPLKGGATTP